jgi:4-carboxymuconolactone decarboxylase
MPTRRTRTAKPAPPRLKDIPDADLTPRQRAYRDAIFSGPRQKTTLNGPFAVWMHAPEFGDFAQQLGAHCRYRTAVPPRLSEFAILVTARLWRAQYEWYAHAPLAERAGVKPQTIRALRSGRVPAGAPADERAIYDFIRELYRTRRVRAQTYARLQKLLGDAGMVELVGILGYYTLISMTLNVFASPIPEGVPLPFSEPA